MFDLVPVAFVTKWVEWSSTKLQWRVDWMSLYLQMQLINLPMTSLTLLYPMQWSWSLGISVFTFLICPSVWWHKSCLPYNFSCMWGIHLKFGTHDMKVCHIHIYNIFIEIPKFEIPNIKIPRVAFRTAICKVVSSTELRCKTRSQIHTFVHCLRECPTQFDFIDYKSVWQWYI